MYFTAPKFFYEKNFFQRLYFASFNVVRDQNLKCNLIRGRKTFLAYMNKAIHDIYLVYNVPNGKLLTPKKNGHIVKKVFIYANCIFSLNRHVFIIVYLEFYPYVSIQIIVMSHYSS